jgi:ankyrin repeat protein
LLYWAAQRGLSVRLEVLTFLLKNGGSELINKVMHQDCLEGYLKNMYAGIGTPLQLAAGKGLVDLVKLLMDRGADPLIKIQEGDLRLTEHWKMVTQRLWSLFVRCLSPHLFVGPILQMGQASILNQCH